MAIGVGSNRPKDKTLVSQDGRLILEWDAYFQRLDDKVSSLISGTAGVISFEGRVGAVVSVNGDYTASEITNVPAGDIAAITVQAALNELDTEKSPISVTATGATTSRLITNHFSDLFSVKDFGAIGNGIADDRAAFVSAYTQAVADGAPLEAHGVGYNFGSDYTPALTNFRLSIMPGAEWNGVGLLRLDNLVPYQVTPVGVRELISGIYDASFAPYSNVFQNASYCRADASGFALVAQFGEGDAGASGAQTWGGNFVGVASASGGTALGIEVNPVVVTAGGIAYGVIIASAGTQPSTAAIQIQSNEAASAFTNAIVFNNNTHDLTTGSLITTIGGGSANFGIDLNGMTFTGNLAYRSPGFLVDGGGNITVTSTDAGATIAPTITLDRSSASPAANDAMGAILFDGRDSAGNQTVYGQIHQQPTNITNTTEEGLFVFSLMKAGTATAICDLSSAALRPASNDGISLGISGTAFSDLFLASGSVIDFSAGDVTITHSSNKLNFAGATSNYVFDTSVGAGGVTPAVTGFEAGFTGDTQIRLVSNSAVDIRMLASNGNSIGTLGTFTNHAVQIVVNSAEKARIDATGAYILNGTSIPAGGTAATGYRFSSTANFGIFFGSGAPSLSAAKGSLYLRSDGSTINDRAYINTNGSTTWTAIVTVA